MQGQTKEKPQSVWYNKLPDYTPEYTDIKWKDAGIGPSGGGGGGGGYSPSPYLWQSEDKSVGLWGNVEANPGQVNHSAPSINLPSGPAPSISIGGPASRQSIWTPGSGNPYYNPRR